MKQILLSLAFISCPNVLGTTFYETPIEDRLGDSSGVVKAKYVGSTSKRLPTGQVVTEASFHILGLSGIKPNEVVNHQSFKVLLPGGSWQGRTYKVHGVPNFQKGELSYLILKKGKFGFTLANLGMSKLKPIEREGKPYLQSSVFPNKEGVGLISEKDFSFLVESTFGDKVVSFDVDKFIDRSQVTNRINNKRSPSSTSEKARSKAGLNFSMFWLILALGSLGFLSSFIGKGKRDERKSK